MAPGASPLAMVAPLMLGSVRAGSGGSGDKALTARSAATLTGRGTGYGVEENAWMREKTLEGQIYYYNRATGSSQWHLPNELYESRKTKSGQMGEPDLVIFPAQARATLGVDCITEALPSARSARGAAGSAAARGAPSFAAADVDPRDLDKLFSLLPESLADTLSCEDFEAICVQNFSDVAGDEAEAMLSLEDAALLVGAVASEMRSEPAVRLAAERSRALSVKFEAALDTSIINIEEFVAFARYVIGVQYLERVASRA